ncbi:AraC family transcriptional regulator [Dyella mobilis]|nr:AraC family transcriptional regulator [Dyella mobilis]
MGEFKHERRPPSPALAGLVEHYWYVSWDLRNLPAQQQETLPHPNVHYVVEPGLTAIYGVHTGRYVRMLEGRSHAFGIKFKAGAFHPFYGKPVSGLMDRSLQAQDIFGTDADTFERQVLLHDDVGAMVHAAEHLLLSNLPKDDPEVARISELVANIAADRSITSVETLAAQCGLTKRSLQRFFNQYVGVSPKWVINRYRLHEAIAQVQAGSSVAWTELALQLGYFDHAHFIRDFRKLIGRSPADYAKTLRKP